MEKPLDAHPPPHRDNVTGPDHVRLSRARHMGAETKGPRKEKIRRHRGYTAACRRGTTDGDWTWLQRWRSAGIRGLGLLSIASPTRSLGRYNVTPTRGQGRLRFCLHCTASTLVIPRSGSRVVGACRGGPRGCSDRRRIREKSGARRSRGGGCCGLVGWLHRGCPPLSDVRVTAG